MLIFKNLTSKRQVLEIHGLTVCIPLRYAVLNLQNFLKYTMGIRTKNFETKCMTIKTDALNLSVNIIQSIPLLHLLTNLMHQSLDKSSCTVFILHCFSKRAGDHRGYVNRRETNQPTGEHFTQPGHKTSDMTCTIIKQVLPANDPFLRKRREKWWINKYQSIEHGANTQE